MRQDQHDAIVESLELQRNDALDEARRLQGEVYELQAKLKTARANATHWRDIAHGLQLERKA